jgi:glycosyltransferase involved in cell wall biosynthesis
MKILVADQFAQLGGAQRCLLDLLPALCDRGWNLRFAIPGGGPLIEELVAHRMYVDSLPVCALSNLQKPVHEYLRYALWHVKATAKLHNIAADFRPNVIYVNGPRLLPPATLVAKSMRIPLIFHAHNRVVQKTAMRVLGAHLWLGRAKVIACCRYIARCIQGSVPAIETVYNGVPDMRHGARRHRGVTDPVIGVIGRIEPGKGQVEFVKAARLIHRIWPSSRFVLIGAPMLDNGNSAYLHNTMEESRGVPVIFAGWQSDIREALAHLDLLVVPSLAPEATPRVIMEAFSAGVPVVAFATGGIPELIEDGRTGFLVHGRSPEVLAHRILEVLQNRDGLLNSVVRDARSKWTADFRIEMYRQRICDVIARFAA